VFQAARGNGEFERMLWIPKGLKAKDQPGRKAVAAADAVDNIADLVTA
jgi:hypothetical protein